ncbi:phosphate ABC transporter substrate-binding protein PstS [Xylanimonas allomyrinae]|uniref:Phosphate-binding protein n=1 Tax=Xylanimonas allomyrinae TaxID=2509459 RepID=A0A4P6ENM3_9MICO|nr:phosphate ABC transporter substrate-binding protein PstS [Xylanimonas allomyrinae]QAY64026.1 phosphate ABC transporter substrate-binding protein PstS [Xylanimonas allomyrinae]
MSRLHSRAARAAVVLALTIPPLAACTVPGAAAPGTAETPGPAAISGTFRGVGASSQERAMAAWTAGFAGEHDGVTVAFDPAGSGKGRAEFLAGTADFGATDVPLTDEEMDASAAVCAGGNAVDLPVYISPIVVAFDVPGVEELRLSPGTIAGLFTGEIESWDDAAIAADNPGVALPDLAVIPVHRSDSSGTTENFTDYLHATAPADWPHEPASSWPLPDGSSAEGTSGVVGVVKGTPGAVTYADASQAGGLGAASILVGDQWVASSAEGAAGAAGLSPRNPVRYEDDLSYRLDRTTTNPNAYPLVLVSYLLVCSRYEDEATGRFVKAFVGHVASDAGQDAAAAAAGSAPLTPAQREWLRKAAERVFLVPGGP